MVFFIDSSAFYASLDGEDRFHKKARNAFEKLFKQEVTLVTSNYIIVETLSLLRSRLGIGEARDFVESVIPLVKIIWVDEWMHNAGLHAMLTAAKRNLSLVDCISFEIMRKYGIEKVFTFDRRFRQQGFKCLPR